MARYLIGNIKGPAGENGVSPVATVTQTSGGATISITDVNGTTTANISNGVDGAAGPTYTAGTGIDITNNVISATGSGGITTESDPVFSASPAASITSADIADWNAKSDFSGSYNDLTNKPDLSVYATTTALGTGLARKQDTLTAGTNITIDADNVISATSGITEDDIKDGLTIQQDHEEGEGYNELTISSTDGVYVTDFNEDGNEFAGRGFGYAFEADYSEENGNTFKTEYSGDLEPSFIGFSKNVNNQTQDQQVEQKDITISANFDDDIIEVEFNDGVAGTTETKTIAFVEDLPEDELPDYSSASAGDVLAVDSHGGLEWTTPSGGGGSSLPTIAAGDAGKVLTVNSGETGVEWAAVSGGGGSGSYTWTDELYTINSLDATGLTDMGTALSNGFIYPVVKYGNDYYHLIKINTQSSKYRLIYWTFTYENTQELPAIWIQFYTTDYSFVSAGINHELKVPKDARYLSIRSNESVTSAASTVAANLLYIRDNYALKTEIPNTSAHPAAALYFSDANNVVYSIHVATDGTLQVVPINS